MTRVEFSLADGATASREFLIGWELPLKYVEEFVASAEARNQSISCEEQHIFPRNIVGFKFVRKDERDR